MSGPEQLDEAPPIAKQRGGVVDLMLNIPGEDNSGWYEFLKPLLLDAESRQIFEMPAQYMFKNIPDAGKQEDYISWTVDQMDTHGIEKAMLGVAWPHVADGGRAEGGINDEACRRHPDRFFPSYNANPNRGMDEVRKIVRLYEERGLKAVTGFPSGLCPQVPIDDRRWYPIYAKCVELDIPFCCTVGVPGPRVPMAPQKVELIDPVCWFFPELKFVMRHGGQPWVDLAIRLMRKYPNLYYCTSAFAPCRYPPEIIEYANKGGADKVMYAGYFPMGLSLDRIFSELPDVPLKDEVRPKFLRDNAVRVFGLDT